MLSLRPTRMACEPFQTAHCSVLRRQAPADVEQQSVGAKSGDELHPDRPASGAGSDGDARAGSPPH